jgi:hypothetical protein
MKKLFSVLVLLCWLTRPAHSQGQKQGPFAGQLEAMKTGFITNRLQLTNEEAQNSGLSITVMRRRSAGLFQFQASTQQQRNSTGRNVAEYQEKIQRRIFESYPAAQDQ